MAEVFEVGWIGLKIHKQHSQTLTGAWIWMVKKSEWNVSLVAETKIKSTAKISMLISWLAAYKDSLTG